MLIDLHCHTLPLSQCSSLQPEELADLARARGLDAVCLTEHDAIWDARDLACLNRRTGFLFLPGIELTTDAGHILCYGLREGSSTFATVVAARAAARDAQALLYLAHPARDGLLRLSPESPSVFASVESQNGSDTALQNLSASGLARAFSLPGIGGSDAHTAAEVGAAATEFDARVTDIESLLTALRSGRYRSIKMT